MHGVRFEERRWSAFLTPHASAANEGRPINVRPHGMSLHSRLLFVVSAEVDENIRIISARKASTLRPKVYENGPKE
jgi:uncharacterized DUF497 family protein